MLALLLIECVELDIKKVLITCDKNNIVSVKTMINNGAKLANEIPEGSRITQRYWITLN
ncbi:acetyltransferase [Clostridium sp. CM027]|nr:acetyltransferase [Clostridium sp. CM027]MBW9146767.1 acetyltransferase [Clostridium sp. CM027]UVE42606.1 acetyltransferase [Clostridium sp. CM027]